MGVIRTEEDLRTFRRSWSGEAMLDLLEKNGGRILVNWAIGVGKSFNLDNVLEAAIRGDKYDLVIVLSSRTQLVEERRWVRDPPQDIRVVQLKSRPFLACGQERDRDWKILEKGRMGTLGRSLICNDACPRREECFWPIQYHSDHLEGTKVIYGTQVLVTAIPELVPMLKRKTGAGSILVLLDEIHFLQKEFCRKIDRHALTLFVSTLQDLQRREPSGYNEEWIYSSELLLHARTEDLRFPDWRFPFLDPTWVLEVQKVGWALHRQRFRFLGYDLRQFGYSLLPSRERDSDGTIIFAAKPNIPCNFILYSAIADPQFVRFRLGIDLASPFSECRFKHDQTVWYNLACRIGAKRNFRRNRKQILDFFAYLIRRRLKEGKRVLLVSKLCFQETCKEGIEERLHSMGLGQIRVITGDFEKADLVSPQVLPLLHYGIEGVNRFSRFSGFDCVFFLNSYYVNEGVLDSVLQDVVASDLKIPTKIKMVGRPPRRCAGVKNAADRFYDVNWLAQLALIEEEAATVVQTVGRARPFTLPREVITFQCGELPGVNYDAEFSNLAEARVHFGIDTHRQAKKEGTADRVRFSRRTGLSQSQTSAALGVSLSTVKRHWRL